MALVTEDRLPALPGSVQYYRLRNKNPRNPKWTTADAIRFTREQWDAEQMGWEPFKRDDRGVEMSVARAVPGHFLPFADISQHA